MTGTASEIYDDENNKNKAGLLSAWLSGKINTNNTLIDITEYGCTIRLSNHNANLTDSIKLVIMSPENNEEVYTTLISKYQRSKYFQKSNIVKIKFDYSEFDDEKFNDVIKLIDYFKKNKRSNIQCSTINL